MKLQTIDEFQTSRLWLMPDGFGDDALVGIKFELQVIHLSTKKKDKRKKDA